MPHVFSPASAGLKPAGFVGFFQSLFCLSGGVSSLFFIFDCIKNILFVAPIISMHNAERFHKLYTSTGYNKGISSGCKIFNTAFNTAVSNK